MFVAPYLDQNPFRSLPYIVVQLPAVVRAAKKSRIGEIKLPSLFHTSSRRLSTSIVGVPGNLGSRSSVVFESGTRGGDGVALARDEGEDSDGEGEGGGVEGCAGRNRHRHSLPLSTYALYTSVVTVVERLYFLSLPHSAEWVEDEEQHTDWANSSYFASNSNTISPNGALFPGVRPSDSASVSNFGSMNPTPRPVSGLGFALASSNAAHAAHAAHTGHDQKPSFDGYLPAYHSSQITSSFSRNALSFSHSPPLSPVGAHARDPRKTLRPVDAAFPTSLSAVVEDLPAALKTQQLLPHTQETVAGQEKHSGSGNDVFHTFHNSGVRGSSRIGAGVREKI